MSKFMPYETIRATRKVLSSTFPEAFRPYKEDKQPLKVGIINDIKEALPEISGRALHAAIGDYCGGVRYLKNVVDGAPRIGLDGQPAGAVNKDQAAYAAERLITVETNRKEWLDRIAKREARTQTAEAA